MEISAEQLTQLLDKGIVAGLFVATFVYVLWRGVPAGLNMLREYLEKIEAEHTHRMNMVTSAFDKTMEDSRKMMGEVVNRFIEQIERQHKEASEHHQEHRKELEDVKKEVVAIGGKVEKALKSRK